MPELKEFEFGGDRYFVAVNPDRSYAVFSSKKRLVTAKEHSRKGFQEAVQEAAKSSGSKEAADALVRRVPGGGGDEC